MVQRPCRYPLISIWRVPAKFWSLIHARKSQARNMKNDGMFGALHVRRTAVGSLGGLLRSSSRAIRAAARSSRNPNSVSGTFLWVQSKRDRLLSGLPETSTYTGGSTHGPANFLPSTHLPLPMKSFTLTHSNSLQPETLTRQIAHNFCVSFRAPNLTLRTRRHSYVGFHWCGLLRPGALETRNISEPGAAESRYFVTIFRSLNLTILLER